MAWASDSGSGEWYGQEASLYERRIGVGKKVSASSIVRTPLGFPRLTDVQRSVTRMYGAQEGSSRSARLSSRRKGCVVEWSRSTLRGGGDVGFVCSGTISKQGFPRADIREQRLLLS